MSMTRKKYIKYLMGYFGWSRNRAVARAKLVNAYNIPYENSFYAMLRKAVYKWFGQSNPYRDERMPVEKND